MKTPPLSEQFCDQCRYWRDGECRRHAPMPRKAGRVALSDWPNVQSNDWCGEWVAHDEVSRG
jgi:hypothetical protein